MPRECCSVARVTVATGVSVAASKIPKPVLELMPSRLSVES